MPERNSVPNYGEEGRRYWIGEGCRDDGGYMPRWLCESNLRDLGLFLGTLEDLIESGEKTELEEVVASYGDRPVPWEDEHPWWWQGTITPQFRQSFIITLGTATEFHLRDLCDHVRFLMDLTKPLKKAEGEGLIEKAQSYLVAGDPGFSSPGPETWEKVKALYRLRNQFAHNGSLVPESGEKRENLKKDLKTLEDLPGSSLKTVFLEVDRGFCEAAHELIAGFFTDLYEEFRRLCERLRAGQT